jgi:hypothetical protein
LIGRIREKGTVKLRAVVVTVSVAVPVPEARLLGLTLQVVAQAYKEQFKLTCEANPFSGDTERALEKSAVWPALTVWVVVPEDVREKSGGEETTFSVTFREDGR